LNAGRRAPETTVVLSLGSNLGAREEHILAGVSMLGRVGGLRILALSSLYETSPVGISTDRSFINAACIARCALPARDLLAGCREIERGRGRSAGLRQGWAGCWADGRKSCPCMGPCVLRSSRG